MAFRRSAVALKEWFPSTKAIKYEGPSSRNPLSFSQYNADEVRLCPRGVAPYSAI